MELTLKDFEPDSFVLERYVEKLTQLDPSTGMGPLARKEGMSFDAKVLHESFQASLATLREFSDKIQTRVGKIEFLCEKQQKEHSYRVKELEPTFQDAFSEFQVLEDRITYVARKVVHLGDQLEASNNYRNRDIEAKDLMEIMTEFGSKAKPSRSEFTDPHRITEAADLINKLSVLAHELPQDAKYHTMQANIATKYVEIEKQLVNKFREALPAADVKRMKLYASTLKPFLKGSSQCVQDYLHHHMDMLQKAGSTEDVFGTVKTKCVKVYSQMTQVFENPEEVLMKFIQMATEKVLLEHVNKELQTLREYEMENYLQKLFNLHSKAMIMRDQLARMEAKIDSTFLTKTIRATLFGLHLSKYAETEVGYLKKRCEQLAEEFYSQHNIQKKSGGAVRTLQLAAGDLLSRNPEDFFVSENVCTTVVYESKNSIRRCNELLTDRELSHAMRDLFLTVLDVLCADHFSTALDLAGDVKIGPGTSPGLFLQVVGCVNKNLHLIEKQYRELILPAIHYAPVATVCNDKKREMLVKLEAKIESGIEKSMAGMIQMLSQLLAAQKKTDYRPEEPDVPHVTQSCMRAVTLIRECTEAITVSLDGKNAEVVLMEYGMRVHRHLYEHILTFTVNCTGAMFMICDMNEYRKAVKEFKNPFLDEVFENLQALCNIFVVMPENLKQICSEEPYVSFDRSVIMKMVQMRTDYKTSKLHKIFNQ